MALWAVILAGAVAAAFAGVMLLSRSLYVSAVSLLVVLLQTALIFLLRGAPLLAFLQVMIYAGAVMVLVVVTIMATGGEPGAAFKRFADFSFPRPFAFAVLLASAAVVALSLIATSVSGGASSPADPALSASFSAALFRSYGLATEAVTLLMFLAALAVLDKEPS